jgi:hypothetical protein
MALLIHEGMVPAHSGRIITRKFATNKKPLLPPLEQVLTGIYNISVLKGYTDGDLVKVGQLVDLCV